MQSRSRSDLRTNSSQLLLAEWDAEDAEINITYLELHLRAHSDRRIDSDYWEAGIRFGCLDQELFTYRRDGRYGVKSYRWLRHLLFEQHRCRKLASERAKELRPVVETLRALMAV